MLNNLLREKDKEELIHIIRELQAELKDFHHEDTIVIDERGNNENYLYLCPMEPNARLKVFTKWKERNKAIFMLRVAGLFIDRKG